MYHPLSVQPLGSYKVAFDILPDIIWVVSWGLCGLLIDISAISLKSDNFTPQG
jgi:hypothetical protein